MQRVGTSPTEGWHDGTPDGFSEGPHMGKLSRHMHEDMLGGWGKPPKRLGCGVGRLLWDAYHCAEQQLSREAFEQGLSLGKKSRIVLPAGGLVSMLTFGRGTLSDTAIHPRSSIARAGFRKRCSSGPETGLERCQYDGLALLHSVSLGGL